MIGHLLNRFNVSIFLVAASIFTSFGRANADDLVAADEYDYAGAFTQYCKSADRGERNAQRTCGLMALYGEALYGDQVHRNLPLAKKYLGMAAAQGSAVSKYMLNRLKVNQERHQDALIGIGHASRKP